MMPFPISHWSGLGAPFVNSVQYVNIVIGPGASNNTMTINAVGPKAFILFLGYYGNALAQSGGYPKVLLLNSTTVSAVVNTAIAAARNLTISAVVIDATSSLVRSVQQGAIFLLSGATTGSISINAVNNAYTATAFLGAINNQTTVNYKNIDIVLSLSGTTLTATRQASASGTDNSTVNYCVIEFEPSALNSPVQNLSISWTNTAASATQAITSVDTNKAIIIAGGQYANSATDPSKGKQYASLTNSTTITLQTNTAGSLACLYNLSVVEFAPGVLKSNVQQNTIAIANLSFTGTATITSVTTTQAMIIYLGFTCNAVVGDLPDTSTATTLTNATTITDTRALSAGTVTGSQMLAEFN